MATIKTIYLGDLRTEAAHLQSGTKIITDAPTDNHGLGEYFSPTDLVATALGSCMLTIMGITASTKGFDIKGASLEVTKVMSAEPRRIGEIIIDVYFPSEHTPKERAILENSAHHCPVAHSLHPECKQTLRFFYGEEVKG